MDHKALPSLSNTDLNEKNSINGMVMKWNPKSHHFKYDLSSAIVLETNFREYDLISLQMMNTYQFYFYRSLITHQLQDTDLRLRFTC